MVRPVLQKAISVGLLAVLAGCAAPQSLEMSRSTSALQVPQPAAISALSRKFRAETPYIVNFGFDSDALDAEAMAKLNVQADWIIDHPTVKFRVYGHTDKVGDLTYNLDLGQRRAERVVAYLISRGIAPERLEAMASFGEELPVILTEAPERLNRRTLTDVIGFLPAKGSEDGDDRPDLLTHFEIDVPPQVGNESGPQPGSTSGAGETETDDTGTGSHANSGRGNGDESGDPGKSGGKNNGGDELS